MRKQGKEQRAYKVYAIANGTVIDHLPAGTALKTIELLRLQNNQLLTVGMNFDSRKLGKKDIIKVQNRYLTQQEVNKLALLAPKATINIIRAGKLKEKKAVAIPEVIDGILKCNNPSCVTNNERMAGTRFALANKSPLRVICHYCERYMTADDIVLL